MNISIRERKIESRHSMKCLEGMGSRSHNVDAVLRIHY